MPQYFGNLQTTEQPWSTIGSVQSISKSDSTIHFKSLLKIVQYLSFTAFVHLLEMLKSYIPPLGRSGPRLSKIK